MRTSLFKVFRKARSTVSNSLKSVDLFGYKIVLNYKNDNEYKSKVGGFTSLILVILIIVYGFSSLV